MELILWRHAEAEDGMPDMARKLTSRGHKNARRTAEWLLQRLPSKFTLLASPSERTRQTAAALGVSFKTAASLAPGASVAEILSTAEWPHHKGVVIVVGHQPDLGRVAAHLLTGMQLEWSIKKGGVWWFTNQARNGDAEVRVRAVIAPDMI